MFINYCVTWDPICIIDKKQTVYFLKTCLWRWQWLKCTLLPDVRRICHQSFILLTLDVEKMPLTQAQRLTGQSGSWQVDKSLPGEVCLITNLTVWQYKGALLQPSEKCPAEYSRPCTVHCTLVQWWCRHQVNRPLYHRRQLPLLTVTSITPLTDVTICWAQPMRRQDCVQLTNHKPALTRCDIWPTDDHLIPIFPGLLNIPRWHNTPMLFLC